MKKPVSASREKHSSFSILHSALNWNPGLESYQPLWFANRRLNCSANGIEIESAGGSFHSRLRCYLVLVSLNRSLFANKVRDYSWH